MGSSLGLAFGSGFDLLRGLRFMQSLPGHSSMCVDQRMRFGLETRYSVNQETDLLVTKAISRACQHLALPGAKNEHQANRGSEKVASKFGAGSSQELKM